MSRELLLSHSVFHAERLSASQFFGPTDTILMRANNFRDCYLYEVVVRACRLEWSQGVELVRSFRGGVGLSHATGSDRFHQ